MLLNKGEVWFVEFPLEENPNRILNRPVVVLDENLLGVLSVKITKHKARKEDPYDIRECPKVCVNLQTDVR